MIVPNLLPDPVNTVFNDVVGRPLRRTTADFMDKATDDSLTLPGVRYLGMELQAIKMSRLIRHAGQWRIVCAGNDLEALRQAFHTIAMAHPDIEHAIAFLGGPVFDVSQQLGVTPAPHLGKTELVLE